MRFRIPLLALVICLAMPVAAPIAGTAEEAKAPKPPSNLSGDWYGPYKFKNEDGTVFLTFVQTGDTGSFAGIATPDTGGSLTINGTYTMNGRKLANGDATVDDGSGPEPQTVTGKASETVSEIKLTFKSQFGKAKVTLTPD